MAWSSSKWCQSFVLHLCWRAVWFFSFMLLSFSNWGPKPFLYMVKIQNSPIGAKIVSIVCASRLWNYFLLCYPLPHLGSKHPSYMQRKLKMMQLMRKWYQSFVLRSYWQDVWFFWLCYSSAPPREQKSFVYMEEIKNDAIGAKMVPVICASFMLVCAVIFFVYATSILKMGAKTPCICGVKIQNCPIGAKMVIIFWTSFLLNLFFICATPLLKLEAKTTTYMRWNFKIVRLRRK